MTDPAELLKGTTPGPWHVEVDITNVGVYTESEHRLLSTIHGHWPGGRPNGPVGKETLATYRLIAAAPELARELVEARAEIERLRNALWYACGTSNVRYLISLRWARDHPDASEGRRALEPKEASR